MVYLPHFHQGVSDTRQVPATTCDCCSTPAGILTRKQVVLPSISNGADIAGDRSGRHRHSRWKLPYAEDGRYTFSSDNKDLFFGNEVLLRGYVFVYPPPPLVALVRVQRNYLARNQSERHQRRASCASQDKRSPAEAKEWEFYLSGTLHDGISGTCTLE